MNKYFMTPCHKATYTRTKDACFTVGDGILFHAWLSRQYAHPRTHSAAAME